MVDAENAIIGHTRAAGGWLGWFGLQLCLQAWWQVLVLASNHEGWAVWMVGAAVAQWWLWRLTRPAVALLWPTRLAWAVTARCRLLGALEVLWWLNNRVD